MAVETPDAVDPASATPGRPRRGGPDPELGAATWQMMSRGRLAQQGRCLSAGVAISVIWGWAWFTCWHSARPQDDTHPLTLLCMWWLLVLFSVNIRSAQSVIESRVPRSWIAAVALAVTLVLSVPLMLGQWQDAGRCDRAADAGRACHPLGSGGALTSVAALGLITVALMTWAVCCLVAAGSTGRVAEAIDVRRPSDPAPGGIVVCCSGGGIRSAAFCLGAVQRMQEIGFYRRVRTLLGVSGGGYIATALLGMQRQKRDGNEVTLPAEPFAVGSPEIALLRRRTAYLASSPVVKMQAVASLLFGLAANLAILSALLGTTSWLVAWVTRRSGMIVSEHGRLSFHTGGEPFIVRWDWAPIAIAGLVFLLFRVLGDPSFKISPVLLRRVYGERGIGAFPAPAWTIFRRWVINLPARLIVAGTLLVLLVPGLPWTYWVMHRFPVWHLLLGVGWKQILGSGVTATIVGALLNSSRKGVSRSPGDSGTNYWRWFQTQVASRLALTIVLAVGYGVLVAWTGFLVVRPDPVENYWVVFGPLLVLLFFLLVATANSCSLFPFYRDRLSSAFLIRADGAEAWPQRGRDHPQFSAAGTSQPTLLMCGTANLQDADLLPVGRGGAPFVFSDQIGFSDDSLPEGRRTMPAEEFERRYLGRFTLSHAMAASGAALAPVAGRENRTIAPYRLLLALANIRLGVWVPNPYWTWPRAQPVDWSDPREWFRATTWTERWREPVGRLSRMIDNPSILHVLREASQRLSVYDPFVYVTDGGHYDNLGLVQALRRTPDRIVVLDSSADPEDSFSTMGQAIATARMDLGVEISDFDPTPMVRSGRDVCASAWVRCTARHRDGAVTEIDYVKSVLIAGLPWDITTYKELHPEFPLTDTADQIYDEFDFEAYRQLGYSLVERTEHRADWTRP